MSVLYPSTAIRMRENPDYRRFGAQCIPTASVATVGQLCFKMLEHLDSISSSHRHSLWFAPGNHLTLVVADVFTAEPTEIEVICEAEIYADALEEFNWDNRLNPHDRRFHLCKVMILGPTASQAMQDSGVVMQATTVTCPSCKSSGRIPGL